MTRVVLTHKIMFIILKITLTEWTPNSGHSSQGLPWICWKVYKGISVKWFIGFTNINIMFFSLGVFDLFSSFLLFQLFFMQLFLEMLPQFSSKCMPTPTGTMRCWIMYGTFWNSIRSPKALVNESWIILSQRGLCQKALTQKRYGLLLLFLLFIFYFNRIFRCP